MLSGAGGRYPRALVLLCFTAAVVALALVVSVTLDELVTAMPRYQENLETLAAHAAALIGVESPTWDDLIEATLGKLNLQAITLRVLGGFRASA